MQTRSFSFHFIAALAGIMLVLSMSGNSRVALAQEGSTTWDKPQEIHPPATPKRGHKRRPTRKIVRVQQRMVERAPYLTVQYRLSKQNCDDTGGNCTWGEIEPTTVFHTGDLLRLSVMPNQAGYLYIVHQFGEEDGQVLFPDSRINNGDNFVAKATEFTLPCNAPSPKCSFKVDASTGTENFIVVFSRDVREDVAKEAASSGGKIRQDFIKQFSGEFLQHPYDIKHRPINAKTPGGQHAYWVTNSNRDDNEDIILAFKLNKQN